MWIPLHAGMVGNEIADQLATSESCSNPSKRISGPISRKRAISEMEIKVINRNYANNLWGSFCKSSPTNVGCKSLFSSIYAKTTSTLPFTFCVRTNHCRLNKHLHRINSYSLDLCSSRSVPEGWRTCTFSLSSIF